MRSDSSAVSRRRDATVLVIMLGAVTVWGLYLGSRWWLPPLASQHGAGIDRMLRFLLLAVGALFVVGHAVLVAFIWRYARQARPSRRLPAPGVELWFSVGLALVFTLIAEGGVLAIGVPVFREYYLTVPPADAVRVEVTGQQFVWNVRYPGPDGVFGRTDPTLMASDNPLGLDLSDPAAADDLLTLNHVVFPVNRRVQLRLRSKDVIHSFFVPHFRVKQDAVPGMTIEIGFTPTREGVYELACTELCGLGHYQMKGRVVVASAEEFTRFLAENSPGG